MLRPTLLVLALVTLAWPADAGAQLVVPAGYGAEAPTVSPAPEPAEAVDGPRARVDVSPLGFGLVDRESPRVAVVAVALALGARLVIDGENGLFLDVGVHITASTGSGLFVAGTEGGIPRLGFDGPSVGASGLAEAGYLHRFLLSGSPRRGLALDLGVGVAGVWIGAQISPGAVGLATLDVRHDHFFAGLDLRGRAIAHFWTGGQADAMLDLSALVRVGFGFGG
jgi:hypothetical protein